MYGKLFDSIFDSSIMEESIETRYVWQCMIALADKDGNVDMTEESLARRVNVAVHIVHNAVTRLLSPDPNSRSPEEDGRRLIPMDVHRGWGWHLVNRAKYADVRTSGDRTTYFREYRRKKRAEAKPSDREHVNEVNGSPRSPEVLGRGRGSKKKQLPPVVASQASLLPPNSEQPKAKPLSSKKPPARYVALETGVTFLDRYPEIDSPEIRAAFLDFLTVCRDEGKALSSAAITQQLQQFSVKGAERTLTAMRNSSLKRLAYLAEPFATASAPANGNGSHAASDDGAQFERLHKQGMKQISELEVSDRRARIEAFATLPSSMGADKLQAKLTELLSRPDPGRAAHV